jgi:hypothetical protein
MSTLEKVKEEAIKFLRAKGINANDENVWYEQHTQCVMIDVGEHCHTFGCWEGKINYQKQTVDGHPVIVDGHSVGEELDIAWPE